jgi:hypothetical protein
MSVSKMTGTGTFVWAVVIEDMSDAINTKTKTFCEFIIK